MRLSQGNGTLCNCVACFFKYFFGNNGTSYSISGFGYTGNILKDNFIIGSDLFMGFVKFKKNIQ